MISKSNYLFGYEYNKIILLKSFVFCLIIPNKSVTVVHLLLYNNLEVLLGGGTLVWSARRPGY